MRRTVVVGIVFLVLCSNLACGDDDDSGTGDTDTDSDNDTDDPVDADEMISDVTVEVHQRVRTILEVTWNQVEAADEVWIRFTFENDEWYESHAKSGEVGEHMEVVLGVPEETDVTIHIVVKRGSSEGESSAYQGTTGSVPAGMPLPTIESYDPDIASDNRWLFGSVNDTPEAGEHYHGPFWVYIIDREGRVVWYFTDLADKPIVGFPRISRDNNYIFFGNRTPWDNGDGFTNTVVKMTLDFEYQEEIEIGLWDNVDMTDDGSLLYNTSDSGWQDSWIKEYQSDGTTRNIWNCSSVFDDCYSNTVNWNPYDDTVLWCSPYADTIMEIDRQSGQVVASFGTYGDYDFSPSSWGLDHPHYANITSEDTLMVSTYDTDSYYDQIFVEFDIDRQNKVLTEIWVYSEGNEWADSMGEIYPIGDGSDNLLGNYGSAGVIKEITRDKTIAWKVKFDAPFSDDMYNKMVGHCTLINDLYAINRGPQ